MSPVRNPSGRARPGGRPPGLAADARGGMMETSVDPARDRRQAVRGS